MVDTFESFFKQYADVIGEIKDVQKLPSGLLPLDYILGGGIPLGRVIEFYGEPGSGKTTTLIAIAKSFLEKYKDKKVLYVDAENSFDAKWAARNGLNVEQLIKERRLIIPMNLDTVDTAFSMIIDAVKTGAFSLVILDSLTALPAKEIFEEKSSELMVDFARPGLAAKKQTTFITVLNSLLTKSETTFVFTNQMRANISMYGPSVTQNGAYALKHATSIRVEVARKDFYPDKKMPLGIEIEYKCTKNKVGIPYRQERALILFNSGLDVKASNINFMIALGIFERRGSFYAYKDKRWQGKERLIEDLMNNEALYNELMEQVLAKIQSMETVPMEDAEVEYRIQEAGAE